MPIPSDSHTDQAIIFVRKPPLLRRLLNSGIVRNSGWLLADKGTKLLLGLIVSVAVARYLGPTDMGIWNFAISFVSFFSVIALLGFDSILPREFVNNKESTPEIMSTTLITRTVSSIISVILAVVIIGFWKGWDSDYPLFVFLLAVGFMVQTADIIDYYFQSILRSKYSAISRFFSYALIAGFKLYLIYIKAPLSWFVASTTIELILTAIGMLYFFKKNTDIKLAFVFRKDLIKDYARDMIPLALASVLVIIYMRIDQVMITEMLGEKENGIYSIGVKILELVYFIPAILTSSYLPAITYVKKYEPENYRAKLLQMYSLITYLAIGLSIVIAVSSFWVMDLLYGAQFLGSGMILFIYSFSIYSTFLGIGTSQYLTTERLLKVSLYRTLIGAIINIILNLILIPKYGINGAAIASVISYTIATFAIGLFKSTRDQIPLLIKAFDPSNIKSV